jgi:hypothetical protein
MRTSLGQVSRLTALAAVSAAASTGVGVSRKSRRRRLA